MNNATGAAWIIGLALFPIVFIVWAVKLLWEAGQGRRIWVRLAIFAGCQVTIPYFGIKRYVARHA